MVHLLDLMELMQINVKNMDINVRLVERHAGLSIHLKKIGIHIKINIVFDFRHYYPETASCRVVRQEVHP